MKAFSPNGTQIIGTLEHLSGRAEIVADTFTVNPDGTVDFDWEGSTEIFYDDQGTVTQNDQRIFLDENGDEWPENVLVVKED